MTHPAMMRNFKLTIEYDGTNYCGWQRQPNGPSIQQTIETALQTMCRTKISLVGSGRTDAGVHAKGQVANFHSEANIPAEAFQKGLNSLLPDDIVIRECLQVPDDFHARFDVKSKMYRYQLRNNAIPAAVGRQYEWWLRMPLDVAAMAKAADRFVGRKDFKAFEGTGSPRAHTIREVMTAKIYRHAEDFCHIFFEIEAEGFLRYMVRNIVGTLVAVGSGKMAPGRIDLLFECKDRNQAPPTAPAKGLCLVRVNY